MSLICRNFCVSSLKCFDFIRLLTASFWAHSSNITTSFPSQQRVYTHGLGVHKATSGACCYAAQSQGPKHGIAPLACHCRYPHTHPCCTSGTDKSLPHRYGPRWLVCGGFMAEDTHFKQHDVLCVTWFLLEKSFLRYVKEKNYHYMFRG